MREPKVVRMPSVRARSFTACGKPCSGPTGSPPASFSSAFFEAPSAASSPMKEQMAFTFGLTRSICERNAVMTSDAETSLSRIIRARSTASLKQSSVIVFKSRLLLRRLRDLDFHSVLELRAARADRDLLAGSQAFDDLDQIAQAVAQLHLALFDRLALNDENFVRAEEVGRRVVRNGQDRIHLIGLNRGFDERAGLEFRAAIGDQGLDLERAVLFVDRRIDARDAAREFASRESFEAEFDLASHAHPGRHLLGNAQTRAQRINVDNS